MKKNMEHLEIREGGKKEERASILPYKDLQIWAEIRKPGDEKGLEAT